MPLNSPSPKTKITVSVYGLKIELHENLKSFGEARITSTDDNNLDGVFPCTNDLKDFVDLANDIYDHYYGQKHD